jgi:hypothetical protein
MGEVCGKNVNCKNASVNMSMKNKWKVVNNYTHEELYSIQALRRQWFAGLREGGEPRAAPYDNK